MAYSHFNKKIFAIGLALLITANLLALTTVFAQTPYVPLAPLPGTTDTDVGGKPAVQNAGNYIKGAFNLTIGIAAVLAIIMIVLGGIIYMGSESLGGKAKGKKWIFDAVLGLLLALGSYIILFTINPSLVNFNVNIDTITAPAAPPTVTTAPTFTTLLENIREAGNLTNQAVITANELSDSAERDRLLDIAEEMREEVSAIGAFNSRVDGIQIALGGGNLVGAQAMKMILNRKINDELDRLTDHIDYIATTEDAGGTEQNRLRSLVEQIKTIQTNTIDSIRDRIIADGYYFSYYQRQADGSDALRSDGPFLSQTDCQTDWTRVDQAAAETDSRDASAGTIIRTVGVCYKGAR
ncbi:MAG: hypothetical protein A3G03_00440 [Candidatus Taylorbacteria bacterium RIFCSPLOWO2_12_FULL_44_15c]|uniref:Uncharacterized protein n=1 Tax=Candidatus Taylorbacteria bacterium RIFCSPLOWO2_12_FULL_44_15c TaxID=1802333 RepID=A0A1G2P6V8_9BACT|nr:MAG: hypothetical protein A3I97_02460 [Candidatus Taylorbacteria bacterium RIFCSPLOWO2_02_FULL_44_35]OHA44013.1 MAG: hypothetical protein A3G03_00440 [Candidatus Taylorbacteria bacterium RIFCSPLOWO2_12_FULL_44_15c]